MLISIGNQTSANYLLMAQSYTKKALHSRSVKTKPISLIINTPYFQILEIDQNPRVMRLPNGAIARPAILKCCLPHGNPMIVIESRNPHTT